jgi:hypothetical protein
MEPISSNNATSILQPKPAVEKQVRDQQQSDSVAPQQADRFSSSNPVSELQLQRSQAVEDLGRAQQTQINLQETETQLRAAAEISQRASSTELAEEDRSSVQVDFEEAQKRLNSDEQNPIRIEGDVRTPAAAQESNTQISQAIGYNQAQQQGLSTLQESLSNALPQSGGSQQPVQSQQQAKQLSQQTQQQIQENPTSALDAQAEQVSKQTALTLFQ